MSSRDEPPRRQTMTCVHDDGTEHPAPSDILWDAAQQRWVRMYRTCSWNKGALRAL